MPFPKSTKNPIEGSPPKKRKRKEVVLDTEDVVDIKGGGYTIAHVGQPMTGKTISALEYGFINAKYCPELIEAGYEATAAAIKSGYIPEVEKIWMIESENAFDKQKNQALISNLLKDLFNERGFFTRVKIKPVMKDEILTAEGVILDAGSLEDIETSCDEYMAAIEQAADFGSGTLVILDSGSRLKKLVDIKSDLLATLRSAGHDDQVRKDIGMSKWTFRNAWWDRAMTLVRGMTGWTVVTFQETVTNQWVVDYMSKKGKEISQIKRIWTPTTAFNFDMIYRFNRDPITDIRSVEVENGRYIYKGDNREAYNKFDIVPNKFGIFPAIEGMIRAVGEW